MDEVADHLMTLGPCKAYVNCMSSDDSPTRLILSKLSERGHLKTCIFDFSAAEAAKKIAISDSRFEITTQSVHDALSNVENALGGVFLDLRAFAPTCHTIRNAPLGIYASLDECVGHHMGISASEWLLTASVEHLAWVIDSFGVLFDPVLSERLAEAIVSHQQDHGPYTSTSELQNVVDDFKMEFQEEHPMLNVAWVVRAIRVFLNNEIQHLNLALEQAFESLEAYGRLVIMSVNIWEMEAVRRFIAEREEPNANMTALFPPARLAELYPQLTKNEAYSIRIAVAPQQCESRGLLHVLEKIPSCGPVVTDCASQRERTLVQQFSQPPRPPFHTSCSNADGYVAAILEPHGDPLAEAESDELKELQRRIVERKARLRSDGLNSSQQKKDHLVADWIARVNKLHNQGPKYLAQIQARCRDRCHVTVLLEEAIDNLMNLGADRLYIDCTFGRGGHTKLLLSRLSSAGRLKAFDIDLLAVEVAQGIANSDNRFEILHRPFGELSLAVTEPIAGVLLDLGVSTPQLQDTSRGFSFANKKNGPFDLRMNQNAGIPASEWLRTISNSQLAWVLHTCGNALESMLAQRVADGILQNQAKHGPYKTTHELANFLDEFMPDFQKEYPRLCLQKAVFVALRVFLNQEMEELDRVLDSAFKRLEFSGRCVVITFNKWERMAVRGFLRDHEEPATPRLTSLPKERLEQIYPLLASGKDYSVRRCTPLQQPSMEELSANQRSRDARLHVLEKIPRKLPFEPSQAQVSPRLRGSMLARARFSEPPSPYPRKCK